MAEQDFSIKETLRDQNGKRMISVRIGYGWQSWLMLVFCLMVTVGATLATKMVIQKDAEWEFNVACDKIHALVSYRLSEHARILWSGSALFASSDKVTRRAWQTFAHRLKIEQQLPGIQGFGFSLMVSREQLASHIQEIRSEGFADYRIKPDGDREIYSSIIYLEPFIERNLRAFGYDMFSEPVRRAAMETARDMDSAALSGKVLLVQETDTNVQAGTLMYTPVYRRNMPVETLEQRRAAIYGWVYSPYRMADLIQGIQDLQDHAIKNKIRLRIFDGEQALASGFLFDNQPEIDAAPPSTSLFSRHKSLDFGSRRWTLLFSQNTLQPTRNFRMYPVFIIGCFITLLLFGLTNSMVDGRYKDGQMAEQRASSLYMRSLIEASPDPMVTIGPDGGITDANVATERLTGVIRENLVGSNFSSYFNEPSKAQSGYMQLFDKGNVINFPLTIRHKSGVLYDVLYNASLYRDEHGLVAGIFAVARDITDQKQMEAALWEERQRLTGIIKATNVGTWEWNIQTGETVFSERWAEIIGYTLAEIAPVSIDTWKTFADPDDLKASRELLEKHFRGELDYYEFEVQMRHKDGSVIWVLDRGRVTTWTGDGKPLLMLGTHQDITERKLVEEQLRRSLKEKETLLREIHHRVKNNMAVVSSLLSLQARKINDATVKSIFEESQQRVKAMALVHERLYQAANLASINFEAYTRSIVSEIVSLYRVKTSIITTEINIDGIELDLETAIPCGLIINELLTNAFKYAFPDNRNGLLKIDFTRINDSFSLVIKDNGIGLPEGFDYKATSTLGFELVDVLTGQIGGALQIKSEQGTEVVVTFKPLRK